jgi:VanZ family protein
LSSGTSSSLPLWVRLTAAFGYLIGTVYFGTVPRVAPLGISNDKLLHASVFFGMVLVTFPSLEWALRRWPRHVRHAHGYAFGYALFVGAALELVQTALPARHGDVRDLLANAMGAGLGYVLLEGAARWQHRPTA